MFSIDSELKQPSSAVRTSLSTILTKTLGHILECGKKKNTTGSGDAAHRGKDIISASVYGIMSNLDDILAHLLTEVPWTLNSETKNSTSTPAVLGKRIADTLRSLYVRANKIKSDNNSNSTLSVTELKLKKSLNDIDDQITEISLSQDLILKNANNKNLRNEEGDKEKAQLQRVFVMREMSLDKVQLMLTVRSHIHLVHLIKFLFIFLFFSHLLLSLLLLYYYYYYDCHYYYCYCYYCHHHYHY